jgi:glycosyltransferase involved in cell wall biosynthesis
MIFLINCSNLKAGGGLQVADSVCTQLDRFSQHQFHVVLPSCLKFTKEKIEQYPHVEVYSYEIPNSFTTIVRGRDTFLDKLVEKFNIDAVLTVFGPSRWCPKVPHLCGFAMAQLVISDSPFCARMSMSQRAKWALWCKVRQWSFKRSANYFWTENPYISAKLEKLLVNRQVYTVSNYYNQVFDHPENWIRKIKLPEFDGVTCLSISTHYPHKNFEILIESVRLLKEHYPDFHVRFVLSFTENEMPAPDDVRDSFVFIGRVDVAECPSLYEQCDIMFMPTLLECFTASYPEAMRMEKPIVTTDLEFARGLCGDAACYYSPVDPKAAAKAIYKVATDKEYAQQLTENGKKQLKTFYNYLQRAEKLISILEKIS